MPIAPTDSARRKIQASLEAVLQSAYIANRIMSYASNASRYRSAQVQSASPGTLVVLLFDRILVSLKRASFEVEGGNTQACSDALDRTRLIIVELLSTLDSDKGGEVADNLAGIYVFLLAELADLGVRRDAKRLERISALVSQLRAAFAEIAAQGSHRSIGAAVAAR